VAALTGARLDASQGVAAAADRLRAECVGRVAKLAAELNIAFRPVIETPDDMMDLLGRLGGVNRDGDERCN
jgi:hypothetical protein